MFSYKSLYQAYIKCRKNKRNTINQLKFEANLCENLIHLQDDLIQRSYTIEPYICFLAKSPKLREIFAANFKDRIVHHLLLNKIESFYETKFSISVYNNRKNKGTHKAVVYIKELMSKNPNLRYLQLDIKGFFYHINKDILLKKLTDDIQTSDIKHKDEILYLIDTIVSHDPTINFHFKGDVKNLYKLPDHKTLTKREKNIGLPIGNITSVFFANVYMYEFDDFIRDELGYKDNYIRYVDDFVLFHNDKFELMKTKEKIQVYLKENLGLSLRDDSKIRKVKDGLDFLGYIIRPTHTLVRRRVVNNYKFKKAKYLDRYESLKGRMSLEEIKSFLSVQASFLAHIKWANSYRLKTTIGAFDEEKYIAYFNTVWHS